MKIRPIYRGGLRMEQEYEILEEVLLSDTDGKPVVFEPGNILTFTVLGINEPKKSFVLKEIRFCPGRKPIKLVFQERNGKKAIFF